MADEAERAVASISRRVGAELADGIVLLVALQAPAFAVFGRTTGEVATVVLGRAVYEVVALACFGRTIGKRLAGIEVVGPGGTRPSWRAAAIRFTVKDALPLQFAVFVIAGLAPLRLLVPFAILVTILGDPAHRGVHDKAAGTTVLGPPRVQWAATFPSVAAPAELTFVPRSGAPRKRRIPPGR